VLVPRQRGFPALFRPLEFQPEAGREPCRRSRKKWAPYSRGITRRRRRGGSPRPSRRDEDDFPGSCTTEDIIGRGSTRTADRRLVEFLDTSRRPSASTGCSRKFRLVEGSRRRTGGLSPRNVRPGLAAQKNKPATGREPPRGKADNGRPPRRGRAGTVTPSFTKWRPASRGSSDRGGGGRRRARLGARACRTSIARGRHGLIPSPPAAVATRFAEEAGGEMTTKSSGATGDTVTMEGFAALAQDDGRGGARGPSDRAPVPTQNGGALGPRRCRG